VTLHNLDCKSLAKLAYILITGKFFLLACNFGFEDSLRCRCEKDIGRLEILVDDVVFL